MNFSSSDGVTKQARFLLYFAVTLFSLSTIIFIGVKLTSHKNGQSSRKEVPQPILRNLGVPRDIGDDNQINLAPKGSSSSDDGEEILDMTLGSSSRDPMIQMKYGRNMAIYGDFATKMDFGPSLDEDGFPLHNVEII